MPILQWTPYIHGNEKKMETIYLKKLLTGKSGKLTDRILDFIYLFIL